MNPIQDALPVLATKLVTLPLWWPCYDYHLLLQTRSQNPIQSEKGNFFTHIRDCKGIVTRMKVTAALQVTFPFMSYVQLEISELVGTEPKGSGLRKCSVTAIAGASTTLFANPAQVFVIAQQQERDLANKTGRVAKDRFFQIAPRIINEGGLMSLYRGGLLMSVRNAAFAIIFFRLPSATEQIIRRNCNFIDPAHPTQLSTAIGFAVAAFANTMITMPVDVLLTLRQSDPGKKRYASIKAIYHAVMQKHGYKIFKTGASWRFLASIIEIAAFNLFINPVHARTDRIFE